MAGEIIRPSALPPRPGPVASEIVPSDNGSVVGGITLEALVNAGRPLASQAEAEAGVQPSKAMTPLTTKQAITYQFNELAILDVASEVEAEAGTENIKVITPLRLTQKLKYDGFLSFGQSDIVFDTATDQSAKVVSFLEGLAGDGGGRALIPSGRRISITQTIRLPDATGIRGDDFQHGSLNVADVLADGGGFSLTGGATIRLGNGCDVQGIVTVNPAVTTRQTQALMMANFTGAAYEFATSTSDHSLFDLLIVGYDTGIRREQNGVVGVTRGKVGRCLIDCKNGLNLEYDYDVPRIEDVHCYPISSYGDNILATSPVDLLRPGTAFRFGDVSDWGAARSCFTYGYFIGFDIDGADHFTLWDCGADYVAALGHDNSIGYRIRNESLAPALIHCKGAARQTGVQFIPTAGALDHPLRISGGTFWANSTAISITEGRALVDGVLIHNGREFENDGTTPVISRGVLGGADADDIDVTNSYFIDVAQPIIGASSAVPIRQRNNLFITCPAEVVNPFTPSVASASTVLLNGKDHYFLVTGTIAIDVLDKVATYAGETVTLEFAAALTIVHSALMRCQGAIDLVVSANDVVSFTSNGTVWLQSTPLVAI